jgi:hypothetical protein
MGAPGPRRDGRAGGVLVADPVRAVRVLFTGATSAGRGVDHKLPNGYVGQTPFIRLALENTRSDPSDNRYATAIVRADCYAGSDGAARALAREVRGVILPEENVVGGYHGTPETDANGNPTGARILGAGIELGPYPLSDPIDLDVYRLLLRIPYF